jgi:hypothetical protein
MPEDRDIIGETPINKQPFGLLGFLGIKNSGRYPGSLGKLLLPTWDTGKLYLDNFGEFATNLAAHAAAGKILTHLVPGDQIWYVDSYSISFVTAVGQTIQVAIGRFSPNQAIWVGYGNSFLIGPSSSVTVALERPMFLMPGEGIGFFAQTLVAGPVTGEHNLRFTRLPV